MNERGDVGAGVSFDFSGLVEKAQLGLIDGLNQAALEFSVKLADELPPGAAAKSIVVKSVNTAGTDYVVQVGIQDERVLKYIYAYWKGVPATITINAHNQFIKFDRWKNGPNEMRWRKDGMFHFRQVRHTYLPHDFVERAIYKFDTVAETISRKLGARLGR